MPDTTTPATAPSPQAHSNLLTFLQVLLHLAPAIAAPFIKNPATQNIFQTEVPIAEALGDAGLNALGGGAGSSTTAATQ